MVRLTAERRICFEIFWASFGTSEMKEDTRRGGDGGERREEREGGERDEMSR